MGPEPGGERSLPGGPHRVHPQLSPGAGLGIGAPTGVGSPLPGGNGGERGTVTGQGTPAPPDASPCFPSSLSSPPGSSRSAPSLKLPDSVFPVFSDLSL